jgi:hypothetical protein
LFAVLAVAGGCIYADPINQRPSLDIEGGGEEVFRGDTVNLSAVANDPESQIVFFQWRAYACTDVTPDAMGARPDCDAVPFYTGVLKDASFVVPSTRADAPDDVLQILVLLEGQDDLGATAKPIQQLPLAVSNHAPDIVLRADPSHGKVVNTSINIYAKVGDRDDGIAGETLDIKWMVYSPITQPAYTFEDIVVPEDPEDENHLQIGKRFRPTGIGDWEIEIRVTDPIGKETIERLPLVVVDDHAPCLAQTAPLAAPMGSALPITDPTLFQVHVVTDDLDPYPTVPGDAELGTVTFAWSILPPGAGTRVPLAATGAAVPLDPGSYAPGDIVELRVEIQDRVPRTLMCTDAALTCSVISDNNCIQRQTWRVEIR